MTKGITLLCIGDPHYGYFAANMALSLKAVSPEIPIQLIHEPHSINYLSHEYLRLFDKFTVIDRRDIWLDKFSPAKAKLSLYKYLAWDETIYFDVDGVAIKDITPLFDECKGVDYSTQVHGKTEVNDTSMNGDLLKAIQWCPLDIIRQYYSFPESAVIPSTNTSFCFVRKSQFAQDFFTKALENIHSPIPIEKIKTWGNGQPDELYVSITLAQLGYIPDKPDYPPVYLRGRKADKEPVGTLDELQSKHYVIGVYGDAGYNHRSQLGYYDRLMKVYHQQIIGTPIPEQMKSQRLMEKKWVRNKR